MTGLSRFGSSQADKIILYAQRQTLVSLEQPFPNKIPEPVQQLDVNSLHNVYAIEKFMQLVVGFTAEIIANLHWTEDFT